MKRVKERKPAQSFAVGKKKFWRDFQHNWQLHVLMLLPLIYVIIFEIAPMYGLQIAFRDYRARDGIWGSDWVGWENFVRFFKNYKWTQYVANTVKISLYSILVGFPVPIILALALHVYEGERLKKVTQNMAYIPHFISMVVMVGILNQIFNPYSGLWGAIQQVLGLNITSDIRVAPDSFIHLYVLSGVWQQMGWDSIIYVSALSAVPQELHEAARLDGASRWKRVLHVDLPTIMPTIAIMLILRLGGIMSVGYEKVYLMQNSLNLEASEVISTYVYKFGLGKNDFSYGTAVGLMNSVINTGMIVLANKITKKLSDGEMNLF